MSDSRFDAALRRTLSALDGAADDKCPDDNAIAAFLEQRLEETERARVEGHAAACSSCQAILGLSLRLDPAPERPATPIPAMPQGRRWFRWSLAFSTVGVVLAFGIGILLLRREDRIAPPQEVQQISHAGAAGKAEALQPPPPASDAPAVPRRQPGSDVEKRPAQIAASNRVEKGPVRTARVPVPVADEAAIPAAGAPMAAASPPAVLSEPAQAKMAAAEPVIAAHAPSAAAPSKSAGNEAQRTLGMQFISAPEGGRNESRPGLRSPPIFVPLLPVDIAGLTSREISKRKFFLVGGYWVDSLLSGHAGERAYPLDAAAPQAAKLFEALPELKQLLAEAGSVIVRWADQNWILGESPK